MRRASSALIVLALFVTACTSDDGADADATTTTTTTASEIVTSSTSTTSAPEAGDAPTVTEDVPEEVGTYVADDQVCSDLVVDVELTCGYVVVPADHDDPDGEQLRVAVARLASTSPTPAPDPVVYLEGGPGGNAIDGLAFGSLSLFESLLETRDVIVVDQRGVGRSLPALDCPEVVERSDAVSARADRTDAEEERAVVDGLERCFDRIRDEGIDPMWFTTPANADDIEVVRRALGVEEWNVFGISYGTRLGLEVLRRHPDSVRTAVLDSVLPPEAEHVFGPAAAFEASFESVAAACEADPACAVDGPLGDRLAAAVAELDGAPRAVDVRNPLTLDELALFADGDLLLGVVAQALYDPTLFVDVPQLLSDIEAGGSEALATYLSIELANRDLLSVGVFAAVSCADEVVVTDPDMDRPAGVDELWVRAIDGVNVGPQSFVACSTVGIDQASPGADEPVVSDVPTLVLAGELDPITPATYGRDVAEDLSAAVVVEHPFLSHATASDPCVSGILAAFVDAPDVALDVACIGAAVAPDLTPEGIGDTTLVTVSVDASEIGPAVSSDVPEAWIDQDVGFGINRARLQGVLDPTAVSVFAGGESTMTFLVESVLDILDDVTEVEPVVVEGTAWERRTGRDRAAIVDVFVDRTDPEAVAVVVVTSGPDQRDEIFEAIVVPVLASVEVGPG